MPTAQVKLTCWQAQPQAQAQAAHNVNAPRAAVNQPTLGTHGLLSFTRWPQAHSQQMGLMDVQPQRQGLLASLGLPRPPHFQLCQPECHHPHCRHAPSQGERSGG